MRLYSRYKFEYEAHHLSIVSLRNSQIANLMNNFRNATTKGEVGEHWMK